MLKAPTTFAFLTLAVLFYGCSKDDASLPDRKRSRIYDSSADGAKQVTDALVLAKKNDKHVLLQFGGDWCIPCIKLHRLFEKNGAIREVLRREYVVAYVEYNERNDHLVAKYRAREMGLPFIVIFGGDGKHLTTKNTQDFEGEGSIGRNRLLAFLNEWTPRAWAGKQAAMKAKPIAQWVQEFLQMPESADKSVEFERIRNQADDAVPYLMDAVRTKSASISAEAHRDVRIKAYRALGSIAPTSAARFLGEQFITDIEVRDTIRAVLIKIGPDAKEAIPAVRKAFHDLDTDGQFRSAWILAHLDPENPELLPTLVQWLKSSNVVARRFAAMILGDLGPSAKSAIPVLGEASADSDETVRKRATNSIARINAE